MIAGAAMDTAALVMSIVALVASVGVNVWISRQTKRLDRQIQSTERDVASIGSRLGDTDLDAEVLRALRAVAASRQARLDK